MSKKTEQEMDDELKARYVNEVQGEILQSQCRYICLKRSKGFWSCNSGCKLVHKKIGAKEIQPSKKPG